MHSPHLEPCPGIVCRKWLLQINSDASPLQGLHSALESCFFLCVCSSPTPMGRVFGRQCFQVCSWDISCSWNSCASLGYPPATWSYREVSSGHGQFSDDLVPLTSLDGYFWLRCLCCREVGLGWARGRKAWKRGRSRFLIVPGPYQSRSIYSSAFRAPTECQAPQLPSCDII